MFRLVIVLTLTIAAIAAAQIQNIAVVENDAQEQLLPNELKNPFYRTPRVRELLARSSWFGPGENPVFDRNADKIPRSEIYSVLAHAGLIPRRFSKNN